MEWLLHWITSGLLIAVTAFILPGVEVGLVSAVITAIVLGFLNTFVEPVLIFLTLPVTILTVGLFLIIINAILVMIASKVVPGFKVKNFGTAILFSIVLSIVTIVFNTIF